MKRLAALAMYVMASCTPAPAPEQATRAAVSVAPNLQMKTFSPTPAAPATRPNAEIAQDFLDLSFRMESGKEIPVLTRFEGPIAVRITGATTAQLTRDLTALLERLRREAGLDISLTASPVANITVQAVPQSVLQSAVPRAACFVVPRIDSWEEFLRTRNTSKVDWTTLEKREKAVIFVPADAAPQEIRDCLHEELAQALGPLNDLYRLPDSVFNDDNIHTVLTGFDMLALRTYYAPEVANGMSKSEVAARLPKLLARLNPRGERVATDTVSQTSRDWIVAMETALSGGLPPGRRRAAAEQAISIGRTMNWSGPREGFAYYAYGRLQVGNNPDQAFRAFSAADAVYRNGPETSIHAAHIAVQMAAFALATGDASQVMALADSAIPIAESHQNAALLATLMMFKAEALEMLGNVNAASQVRLDSLGWARYGFGHEDLVSARLEEIRALRPF